MAKFFLGQRVRLVKARYPENQGLEGRIVALFPGEYPIDCQLDFGRPVRGHGTHTSKLEPILPSGHTASTESFQELMDRLNTQRVEKVEEVGA